MADPYAAPRRRRADTTPPENRRETIVDCAYDAFLAHGFAGATVAMIATRARSSKRAIYEQFLGKTELFGAVVLKHRHLLLDLPRPVDEAAPAIDTLVKIFRLGMESRRDREREALLNLIVRESLQFPALSDFLYENGILRMREDLISWLENETRRGTLVVGDAALCAGMLMDIAFGALLPRRRQPGDASIDKRKADIRTRFAIVLRGLAP